MRAVIQRVDFAKVTVNNQIIGEIDAGLLVYLGVEKGDRKSDADYLLDKILNLRIFEDQEGKMNISLLDTGGGILVISQFTLLADCRKGRRPSFANAEDPGPAKELYEYFISQAGSKAAKVQSGEFQAMMKIESVNDGPVTIIIESRKE
jgi:D-tyrosyl-tRNA(Tyr) deacylase